nr:alpha/beta hydrolase [Chromobacterium sp. ASV5]
MPFDHQRGHYLEVDDARLYFEESGNPAGPPLLLMHGGLGCLLDFNALREQLPADWRLIAMDWRGHGRSTLGSAPLTYLRHQRDAEALLARLGLRRAVLLGFSDGGIAALRLAAARPDAFPAVIALGAHWRAPEGAARDALAGVNAAVWESRLPAAVAHYRTVNPQPDFERLAQAVVRLWLDRSEDGYPGERVRAIGAPTLLIRGDGDFLLPLDELAQLQTRIAGAQLCNVPYARHDVHNEATEFVALAVNACLRRLDTGPVQP